MSEFQEYNPDDKESEFDKSHRRIIQINGMHPENLYSALVKKKIERSIDADGMMRGGEYLRSFYNNTNEAFEDWQVKDPEQINLVWLSVSDLGFDHPTDIKEIYAAARKRGLELCPPSTVGHLSLILSENPLSAGEYFIIATEPPTTGNSRYFKLFTLDQSDSKGEDVYISSLSVRPETTFEPPNTKYPVSLFEPHEQFVFVESGK